MIGQRFHTLDDAATVPATIYFGFDQAVLTGQALAQAGAAARWLANHPESRVELVGHADPVGSDDYNQTLGQARVDAVAGVLRAPETADRIGTRSAGEHELATTDPRAYRLDRRVTLAWRSEPGPYLDKVGEQAQAALDTEIPGPYNGVLQFVPRPVEGANPELEDWHWGSMPASFIARIDSWISGYGPAITAQLAAGALDDRQVEGYTVRPRPIAEAAVRDLLAAPTRFLATALGQQAGR